MTADAPETDKRRFSLTARGRTVLAAGGAVLVVIIVAVVALARGGDGAGSSAPPAESAAKLVPANAPVYVHISTDRYRSATRDAAQVADRFPSWSALRDGIVSRLQAPG